MGSGVASSVIVIRAPRARVWATLVDTARYPEWNPSPCAVEGTLAVGEPIVVRTRPLAPLLPSVFPCAVVVLEPGRALSWRGPTTAARKALQATHGFVLEDDPEGTRFTHSEHFEGPALLPGVWRVLGPLVAKGHAAMNAALKARCET